MPCRYEGDDTTLSDLARMNKLQTEVDIVTDLLCQLCANIEKLAKQRGATQAVSSILPPAVRKWWYQHKIADEMREERNRELAAESRRRTLAEYNRLKKELNL